MKFRYLWMILGLVIVAMCLSSAAIIVSGLRDQLGKADAALVLGSKVEMDGQPSARLQARLDRAVELYREGYFRLIIVSGGIGVEGYDEAAVMRDYLRGKGIPNTAIVTDSNGVTTWASAKNVVPIMSDRGFNSILVISQYFHIPRSRLALRKVGIERVYSAHARYFEMRDIYSVSREVLGYVRYSLRPGEKPKAFLPMTRAQD